MAGKLFEQGVLFELNEPEQFEASNHVQSVNLVVSKGALMAIEIVPVSEVEAGKVIHAEEGQFSDVKATAISPAKLSKTVSAFANSDGGELFIGIDEVGKAKTRQWRGFQNPEAANGHLQCFEQSVVPPMQASCYTS